MSCVMKAGAVLRRNALCNGGTCRVAKGQVVKGCRAVFGHCVVKGCRAVFGHCVLKGCRAVFGHCVVKGCRAVFGHRVVKGCRAEFQHVHCVVKGLS